jgi:predicted outer membrane repeat protein
MPIKQYNPTSQQWEDYNEELVNESVGRCYIRGKFRVAWRGLHAHNGIRFTRWTSTNSLPTTAGNYVLMNDVTLTSNWTPPAGVINICLNGFKISTSNSNNIQQVINITNSNTQLHIYDCNVNKRQNTFYSPVKKQNVTIDGGLITGAKYHGILMSNGKCFIHGGIIAGINNNYPNDMTNSRGAGALVGGNGQMTIYGGRLTHNYIGAHGGAGVAVKEQGKLYMSGGLIDNNYAIFGGAFIFTEEAELHMTDGILRDNYGEHNNQVSPGNGGGGAICIGATHKKQNVIEILGGQIINNDTGSQGGAISVDRRNTPNKTSITLGNCVIANNHAKTRGGAICVGDKQSWENDLSIKIVGNPKIYGNTSGTSGNEKADNIYLVTGRIITLANKLTDSEIGITMQTPGTFTSGYSTYNTETPDTFFSSDSSSYEVTLDSGEAKLVSV